VDLHRRELVVGPGEAGAGGHHDQVAGPVAGRDVRGQRGGVHGRVRLGHPPGPDHQHRGIATALVVDALWWARRRGAHSVLVNTQVTNTGALSLYEHLGFRPEPHGLAVLERPFGPRDAT